METGVGLRRPGSKEGDWRGAVVCIHHPDMGFVSAMSDEEGAALNIETQHVGGFFRTYDDLVNKGWQPMTLQDLRATSGTLVKGFIVM